MCCKKEVMVNSSQRTSFVGCLSDAQAWRSFVGNCGCSFPWNVVQWHQYHIFRQHPERPNRRRVQWPSNSALGTKFSQKLKFSRFLKSSASASHFVLDCAFILPPPTMSTKPSQNAFSHNICFVLTVRHIHVGQTYSRSECFGV